MSAKKIFEELQVWQDARILFKNINSLIFHDSKLSEHKALIYQIQRSSGSIMDNIAEGFDRGGNKEFIQFLSIAKGSAAETRSQLYRILDLKLFSETDVNKLIDDASNISKQLNGFIQYLKNSEFKGPKYNQVREEFDLEEQYRISNFK